VENKTATLYIATKLPNERWTVKSLPRKPVAAWVEKPYSQHFSGERIASERAAPTPYAPIECLKETFSGSTSELAPAARGLAGWRRRAIVAVSSFLGGQRRWTTGTRSAS
jgi:hypothetical protein